MKENSNHQKQKQKQQHKTRNSINRIENYNK